jgi:hypothetical protein
LKSSNRNPRRARNRIIEQRPFVDGGEPVSVIRMLTDTAASA